MAGDGVLTGCDVAVVAVDPAGGVVVGVEPAGGVVEVEPARGVVEAGVVLPGVAPASAPPGNDWKNTTRSKEGAGGAAPLAGGGSGPRPSASLRAVLLDGVGQAHPLHSVDQTHA